ncbi:mucin-5AC [Musca domestica]|uniref:Mucin-5AC n=1 Tax=Musca domestica TaxID=7370 RepID=A0ABM3UW20_MUSDO|nr:mucin-5AC [Musca domestica]
MQTAVDCNGSSSISNSTTTTITTTIETETGNGGETMTQHMLVQATANGNKCHASTSITPTTATTNNITTDHHAHEVPMAVLRHRITTANSNAHTSHDQVSKVPRNGLTHLIDANDYLGTDCKSLSMMNRSVSPQPSPSKTDKISSKESSLGEKFQMNTSSAMQLQPPPPSPPPSPGSSSSSSKTTSNSTSTTSSVIATPILRRNGNVVLKEPPQMDDNNSAPIAQAPAAAAASVNTKRMEAEGGTTFREPQPQLQVQPQQLIKNQMLPLENTSFALDCKREMSSGPSLAATPTTTTTKTMSSSTTSSSINSNASSSSAAAASGSASTTTTSSSITPPPSATTPALLSPSSSTASTTPSSSSSPASGASSIASSTASSMKGFSNVADFDAELLQWQDMPQYLQFNPYVLKGYRPLQTFKGCLLSLFYWHNETINILTHAIPIVYILAIVPGLMPWESGYRFLSFCHVFGSVAPWCGSFVYHLFMNIERGENVYYTLLKLDMVGIWVSQSFGALPFVTATTFCFSPKWKSLIIVSYCLLSLWGLYKALTASSPWQRRLCFALPFSMRSILIFFRTLGLVGGNPVAMSHVYLQDAVSIIGGAIGAMRIPEKWLPGLVDFYLNSHNIMHVLVVIAVYSMHMATIKDFEWMSNTNCEAFTNASSKVLESTLNTNIEL